MTEAVHEALELWDIAGARAEFVARRENEIWRITRGNARFALRFHRPGYRNMAELRSELALMRALADGGLSVPRPVPQPGGALLGRVGGRGVSLLTWLDGAPIGAAGLLSDEADPAGLCHRIGQAMARLHDLTDDWQPPTGFTRPDWRGEGILGEDPLWGRFWEHPHLTLAQRGLLVTARGAARARLQRMEPQLDQGLIHADLLAENILADGGTVAFIDFDDAAFGYRDFELATLLLKFRHRPYHADMRAGLCDGYSARRDVKPDILDFMLLLRALTYPGWFADRLDEPGAAERSQPAIETALTLARDFLEGKSR